MTFPVLLEVILPSQLCEFQLVKSVRGGLSQLTLEMRICVLRDVARGTRESRTCEWRRSFCGTVIYFCHWAGDF